MITRAASVQALTKVTTSDGLHESFSATVSFDESLPVRLRLSRAEYLEIKGALLMVPCLVISLHLAPPFDALASSGPSVAHGGEGS